ncbi:MAG: TonB-dependent receptor [Thermodesulfobacteriota bacterium]
MKKVIMTAALVALTSPVLAQEESATLDEVVVTATKTAVPLAKAGGSSITVISQEELAAKKQSRVVDVLQTVPGLSVTSNGGPGTRNSVFMRGADSKNTLILVDGIIYNDPSSSGRSANLANLTTANIERIEVVRGPMSVLYGSNATAGVINIITKDGAGPLSNQITLEGGSYDSWLLAASSAAGFTRFHYSANLTGQKTQGFSAANADNDRLPQDGNTSEDDGWESLVFSSKFGVDITDSMEIKATVRLQDSDAEIDDSGPGYAGDRFGGWPTYPAEPNGLKERHTESEQYLGRVDIINILLDERFESNFSYKYSRQDRLSFDNDGLESYDYHSSANEAGWQGSMAFSQGHALSGGLSYYDEEMDSDSSGIVPQKVNTSSFWLQEQLSLLAGLELVAGARFDDHETFGSQVTWRLAPAYHSDFGLLVKASYGTGYRAPSLYELYSFYGNVNLEAEESVGWDVGLEQEVGEAWTVGLTYFHNIFDDRIDYDFVTSSYNQMAGETTTQGVEAMVRLTPLANLTIDLNYTYTDTEAPDGQRLARRPLHSINANGRLVQGRTTYNVDLLWNSERDESPYSADRDGNAVASLDAYLLVNLAVSHDLNDSLQLYGRVDNLFDEEYETAWSYATPGLSGYAGLKVTF